MLFKKSNNIFKGEKRMMINLSNTLKKKNNKKGFTLIELIVVIAILAILAAIAIPRFTNVTADAKLKADNASATSMESAVRIFEAQGSTMPTVTNKATFVSGFATVLPDGVPAVQTAGNEFYYNTTDHRVVCAATSPGNGWVDISN